MGLIDRSLRRVMPYKDKEKSSQAVRDYRNRQRGLQSEGITPNGLQLLHRPNGEDYNPDELLPDGRKRYLGPFHDGQVLDRLTVKPDYIAEWLS